MIHLSRAIYHALPAAYHVLVYPLRVVAGCALLVALACSPSAPEGDGASRPPRIVSVGPELGRVLVELGVGPGVVAVDSASLGVPELAHAVDLGDRDGLSPELARRARPDLVLVLADASAPEAAFAAALEAEGLPAHVFSPVDANGALAVVHRLGRLLGRERRASAVAARLTREVSEIAVRRDGRKRLLAAWVVARDPWVAVGGIGFLHELLELAGADNAFHGPTTPRVEVTVEEIAARGPDVVLSEPALGLAVPGARPVAIDAELAALPLLDVPARVRALHELLYPASGPPP